MRDFQLPGRSAVFATNGMCATSHPLAAETAVAVLRDGGNAVDAALAAGVLLGLCEPHMCGIGGDCFVLLSLPGEDRVVALNGSGPAPAGADAEVLRDAGHVAVPLRSAASVTVPGAVAAFCKLSEDWGRFGLDRVLAPAIHYAEEGVPVAPRVAADWAGVVGELQGGARPHFLEGGKAPSVGTVYRNPAQARALRLIADQGPAGFYEGAVAEDMVAALAAMGGVHRLEDFAGVTAEYADPIRGPYKGVELVEHPPNGQGATAILMAAMLAEVDLPSLDPHGAERAHLEAEAAKLAYDARNRFIADPGHTSRLDHMLSPETARALAAMIDPDRAMPGAAALSEAVHRDTVYVTVVDRDRMAVSLIYSLFHGFGSGIGTDEFGIVFHNRGAGFTLEAGHPNEYGPGKRPMHTIIPGMLRENGLVTMSFGVMGGAYQPNGHARFLTNLVDFGMDLQTAIDASRSFAEDGALQVERGYSDAVRAKLAQKGHKVVIPQGPIGGAQAIRIDHETGVLEGASDPRKDGAAIGY